MSEQETTCVPRIWAFSNGENEDGCLMVAIAEDGAVLGSHFCSSPDWAHHDLHERADRKAACEAHYPNGYEFVVLPVGQFPPDAVFDRNAKRQTGAQGERG